MREHVGGDLLMPLPQPSWEAQELLWDWPARGERRPVIGPLVATLSPSEHQR